MNKQAKISLIASLLIAGLFLVIILPSVNSGGASQSKKVINKLNISNETRYGINWDETQNPDGSYTRNIYPDSRYMDKVVNITEEGENIVIEYEGKKTTISLGINGKDKAKKKVSDLNSKSNDWGLTKKINYKNDTGSYEFSFDLKNNKGSKMSEFESFNYNIDGDIKKIDKNQIYLSNGLIIDMSDLIANNFNVSQEGSKSMKVTPNFDISSVSEISLDPQVYTEYTYKDTYLRLGSPNSNYGTDATATFDDGSQYKALVDFSYYSIPANSSVTNAVLSLYFSTTTPTDSKTIYPVLHPWTEIGATWNTRDGGTPWDTAGLGTTDYNSSLGVSFTGESGWRNIDITNMVNLTMNGRQQYGFVLVNQDGSDNIFRTYEYFAQTYDPYITVTYDFPPVVMSLAPANNTLRNSRAQILYCNMSIPTYSAANVSGYQMAYGVGVPMTSSYYWFDYVWPSLNDTTSPVSANSVKTNWSVTFPYDGLFYWSCAADVMYTSGSEIVSAGTVDNYKILIDTTAPTITYQNPTPADNARNTTNSITINVSVNDNASSCILQLNNTASVTNYTGTLSSATSCYQESANVSTSCGGVSTGVYSTAANYFYVNYTKPSNAMPSSLWQLQHGNLAAYNASIPGDCWSYSATKLSLRFNSYAGSLGDQVYSRGECFNGTSWNMLTYEEWTTNAGFSTGATNTPQNLYDGNWGTSAYYNNANSAWWVCSGLSCLEASLYDEAMVWNIGPSCNITRATVDGTNYWYKVFVNDTAGNMASTALRKYTENDEPTVPTTVTLTPTTAYKNTTFTCAASGSTDANGDTVTYYYQFNDTTGILQAYSTTATFSCSGSASCVKGDIIRCNAKGYDTYEYGTANTTAASVTILNSPVDIDGWSITNGTWTATGPGGTGGNTRPSAYSTAYNVDNPTSAYDGSYGDSSTYASLNQVGVFVTAAYNFSLGASTSTATLVTKWGTGQVDVEAGMWAYNYNTNLYDTQVIQSYDWSVPATNTNFSLSKAAGTISSSGQVSVMGYGAGASSYGSVFNIYDLYAIAPTGNASTNYTLYENTTGGTYVFNVTSVSDTDTETHWYDWFIDSVKVTVSATNSWFNWALGSYTLNTPHNVTVVVNDSSNAQDTQYWNITLQDANKPTFSSYVESPTDPVAYTSAGVYYYNVTLSELHPLSVWVTFDSVNYSGSTYIRNISNVYIFNRTGLSAGVHNYQWWANDTSNNRNSSTSQTYTINTATPTVSTNITSPITYGTASNYAGSESNVGDGGCTFNLYRNNVLIGTGASVSDTTVLAGGSYTYVYNTTGCTNYSSMTDSHSLTVNPATTTTTLTVNPASPITYGTASNFSCSNTGGLSTILYIDGVNKTSEKGLNVTRSAATYTVNCTSIANSNYSASSQQASYTINKAAGNVALLLNAVSANLSITYPATSNASASTTYGTVTLYDDGTSITNNQVISRSAGTHNITAISTGDTNHSSASITWWIIEAQASRTTSLTFNPVTQTQIYGTQVNATCTASAGSTDGSLKLYRAGVDVTSAENGKNATLGVANYTYICNITAGTNYSSATTTSYYNITKKVPTGTITSSAGWTVNFGTPTTIAVSETNTGDGDVTYIIYRDGVSKGTGETVSLGAGTYNYILNTTGGTNYTINSSMYTNTLTIVPSATTTSVLVNPASPITYGTNSNFSCNNSVGTTPTLYINGVDKSSERGLNVIRAVGVYTVNCTTTANGNNSASSAQTTYTINTAPAVVYTYLNNSRANLTLQYGNTIWLNATRQAGEGTIYLYKNGTLINSGSGPLSNSTLFNALGLYNITTIHLATGNYSAGYETWWLNMVDTVAPAVTVYSPTNTTYRDEYDTTLGLNVGATDAGVGVSTYWYRLNSGVNTTFTPNTTLTGLVAGSNTLRVYVNDTQGNLNTTTITFYLGYTPKINTINVSNGTTSYTRDYLTTASDGLKAWWKMDENNTNVKDYVAGGVYNGTLKGKANFTNDGLIGGGIILDGTLATGNTYIDTPIVPIFTAASVNESATFIMWIRTYGNMNQTSCCSMAYMSSGTNGFIQGNAVSAALTRFNGWYVFSTIGGGGDINGGAVDYSTGYWHMLVSTINKTNYNATHMNYTIINYLDGVQKTSTSNLRLNNTYSVQDLGGLWGSNTLNASMDEVRIYNRSLSSTEITNMYSVYNPTFQEAANVTITTTVTDEDTTSGNLYYSWFVNSVSVLTGFSQNVLNWIFIGRSNTVQLNVNDTSGYFVNQTWNITETFITPTINFTSPTPGNNSYQSSTSITFNFTGTEINRQSGWVTFNGVNYTATCTGTSPYYCNKTLTGISPGTYNYIAYVNDTVGNVNNTDLRTITIDTTTPTISISYPTAGFYYPSGPTAINYTVSDNIASSRCWYSTNGGTTNSTPSVAAGTNFTGLTSSEGSNTWIVYCNDTSSNVGSDSHTFILDTIAPVISYVSPTPTNNANLSQTSIYINTSVTEVNGYYVATDFNGDLLLRLSMDDINSSGSPTDTSRYANNATKNGSAVQTDSGYFGKGFHFDGTNGSFISVNNPVPFQTGSQTVSAWIYLDSWPTTAQAAMWIYKAGNLTSNSDISIFVGNQAGTKYVRVVSYDTSTNPVYADYADQGVLQPNTWLHIVGFVDANTGGWVNVMVNGVSGSGMTFSAPRGTTIGNQVVIGGTPGDSSQSVVNGTIDELMVWNRSLSNDEAKALYNATAYKYSNNFTSLSNGVYSIKSYSRDRAGNNDLETLSITLDTSVPTANLLTPTNNTYNSTASQNYTVNITDNSGIKNATLNIINSTGSTINQTTTTFAPNTVTSTLGVVVALTDGVYKWFYKIFDWSGNSVTTTNNTITIDTLRPGVSITYPLNTTYTTAPTALNYTYTEINPNSCWYSTNGGTTNTSVTCGTNKTGLTSNQGSNTWMVALNDSANNINVTYISFFVDTINPTINFTSPTETSGTSTGRNNIVVNVTSTDTNLANITIYLYNSDKTLNRSNTTTSSPNFINYTNLADGTYYFNATARDTLGNSNSTTTYNVTLDATKPLISFIANTQNSGVNISQNFVYVNLSLTESNFQNMTFTLKNLTATVNTTVYTSATTSINWTNLPETDYTYYVNITDRSNNINSTEIRTITLDTNAPSAILVSPGNGTYNATSSQNFTTNLSDNLGIKNATLNVYNSTGLYNSTTVSYVPNTVTSTLGIVVALTDGVYNWWYQVWDWAGNNFRPTNNNTITIDTSKPGLSITFPSNTSYTTDPTTFNYTYSELNPSACWYSLNSGTTNTSTSCGTNLVGISPNQGSNTWLIVANDSAGNVNISSVTFFLDSIKPTINYVSPTETNGAYLKRNNIVVNVTSTDTNLKNITIYLYNSNGALNRSNTTVTSPNFINYTNMADGLYFFNVTALDGLNSNSTTTYNVTVDTTYPQISYNPSTTTNGTWRQSGDFIINISASDTNKNTVGYEFGGVNYTTWDSSSGNNYWITKSGLTTGTYTIYAWINDTATNFNKTALNTYYVDREDPIVTILNPVDLSTTNSNTSLPLNFTATDTNLQACWYNFDNGANTTIACTSGVQVNTLFSTSETGHTVNVFANDSSGRVSSHSHSFNINLASPGISVSYPSNNLWINYKQNVGFNYTATDATLNTCQFWINSTGTWALNQTHSPTSGVQDSFQINLTDGSFIWNIWCNDSFNNAVWAFSNNYTINVDTVYPQISYGIGTQNNGVNLSQNSNYVNVSFSDTNFQNITFTIKNLTAIVNSTTFTSPTYTINWTNLPETDYTYYVNITDKGNNKNSTPVYSIRLDKTAPSATLTTPGNGTYNATLSQNLTGTLTDNVGLKNATLFVYNQSGLYNQTSVTLTNTVQSTLGVVVALVNGVYNWWYQVWDWSGNTAISTNNTVTIDNINPVVSITYPVAGNYTTIPAVLNYTTSDTNPSKCWYSVNNGVANSTPGNCGTSFTVTAIQGWQNWTVYENDSANNLGSDTHALFVDSINPTINFTSPTETSGTYQSRNNIQVNVTSTDTNLVNITISLYNSDRSLNRSNTTTTSPNFINYTSLADGIYFFNATTRDVLNNGNSTETRNVTVDTTYPLINYSTGTTTDQASLSQTNIYVNLSVTETNLANITYTLKNLTTTVNTTTFTTPIYSLNWTNLPNTNYTYYVNITDKANNQNSTVIRSVQLDNVIPSVNIVTPATGLKTQNTILNVNYTVSDNNLRSCWYYNGTANTTITCGTNITTITWPQATTTVIVYANDSAGNIGSSSVIFTVDTVAPTISITSPLNTTYRDQYNYSYALTTSALDSNSGISTYWYSLNSGANTTFSASSTLSGLVSGSNSLTVWINDTANNINSTSVTFYLSFTPKINAINVSNSTTSYIRDSNSSALVGYWKLDRNWNTQLDSSNYGNNGTVTNAVFTSSGTIGGAYTFDGNGDYITIADGSQYSLPITSSYSISAWVNPIKMPGAPSNNLNPTIVEKWDGIGAYPFAMRYINSSGKVGCYIYNSTSTVSVATSGDLTGKNSLVTCVYNTTNIIIYVNGIYDNIVSYGGLTGTTTNAKSIYIGTRGTTQEYFNGTIDEVRIYNNSLTATEISNLYSLTNPNFQEYSNSTINVTVTDEDTTGANLYYSWVVDSVSVLTGFAQNVLNWIFIRPNQIVQVTVNDTSGYNVTQVFNISTNFINPTINYTGQTPGNNTFQVANSFTVNFTGTETNRQSGWVTMNGANYTATCTGTSPYYCNKTFSGLADAVYNYQAFVNDSVGNLNYTDQRRLTIDSANPVVSITYPLATNYITIPVVLNYTITETNPSSCWYSTNGGTTNSSIYSAGTNFSITATQGSQTWTVYCNDSVNNLGSDAHAFFVDSIIPTINFTGPTPNTNSYQNTNSVTINVTGTDTNRNLTWVTWNNVNYTMTCTGTAPYYCNYTFASLADAAYTYKVWINDSLNNMNYTEIRNLTVDVTKPLISYGNGNAVDKANLSQTNVYVNVSFTETNFKNITFTLKNDTGTVNSTTFLTPTYTINWTGLPQKNYTYWVNITDLAENKNSTSIYTITLDASAPSATLIGPTNGSYNSTSSQNLTTSLSDNLGIKNATLYIYNQSGLYNSTTTNYAPNTLTATLGIVVTLVDNTYNWWYQVWDWAGNSFRPTSNYTINIDAAVPQISYNPTTTTNGTWRQGGDFFINITASDLNKNVVGYEYNGVNSTTWDTSSGNIYTLNKTGLATGSYTIYVWMNDTTGNFNKTLLNRYYVDREDPVVSIVNPLDSSILNYNTTINFNFTATDTNLQSCWWNLDNGVNNSISCTGSTTFGTSEASHTITIYGNDSSGRVSSHTHTFQVNLAPPGVAMSFPTLNGQWVNYKNNFQFNYTASDSDSISSCQLWGNWTGIWTLNQSRNPTSGILDTFTVNLTDGSWAWNIWCNDTGNNGVWAFSNNYSLNVDTIYPLINFTGPTSDSLINVSRNWIYANVSVTESNLKNITFYLYNSTALVTSTTYTDSTRSINWTNQNDGLYYYNITTFDNAGNKNQTETRSIRLDTTAPSLTIVYPTNTTYRDSGSYDFNLNITSSDSGVGIQNYWYSLNGAANQTFTPNISITTIPGSNTINVWANDTLGNLNSASVTFYLGFTPIINNWTVSNSTTSYNTDNVTFPEYSNVTINTTVTDADTPSGNLYYNWLIDGVSVVTGFAQNVFNWIFTSPSQQVQVIINDTSDYQVNQTWNITTPFINPTINFTGQTPENGTYRTTNSFIINYTGTEANINSTWFTMNGVNYTPTCTGSSPYYCNYTFSTQPDSQYNFTAYIIDQVGNTNQTENRTFIIDTLYPQIDWGTGTLPDNSNVSQSNIYMNTTWTEANLENITFYRDTTPMTYTTTTYEYDALFLSNAVHTYYVIICDKTNRCNQTTTRTITLDRVNPSATSGLPTDNTYINNNQTNHTITASDNLGLKNATLKIYDNTDALVNETTFDFNAGTVQNSLGIVVSLADGVYKWFYKIFDWSGNSFVTSNSTYTLDTANPAVSITQPSAGDYVSLTTPLIRITTSDTYSDSCWYNAGGANITIPCSDFSPPLSEGLQTVIVYANDSAGNLGQDSISFYIDAQNPIINFENPTLNDGVNSNNQTIVVNVSVTELNEASISFDLRLNGTSIYSPGAPPSYADGRRFYNWTVATDGNYTYYVTVNDRASNSQTVSRSLFLDSEDPEIDTYSPIDTKYANNNSILVNISATDSGLGLDTCWFTLKTIGGTTIISYQEIPNCQNITFGVPAGDVDYTIYIYANDTIGNLGETETIFGVRTVSPAIQISDTYMNRLNNIQLSTLATDVKDGVSALGTCQLWGNWNGTWALNQTKTSGMTSGSTFYWTNLTLNQGDYTWAVWCNDTYNNNDWSNNRTLQTDIIYPLVNITKITPSAGSQTIFFNYTASDLHLSSCKYSIFDANGTIDGLNSNVTISSCTLTGYATVSAYGSFNLSILVSDQAGNMNTSRMSFTVSAGGGNGGGGGGNPEEPVVIEKVSVFGLTPPGNVSSTLTDLERAILYKEILASTKLIGKFAIASDEQNLLNIQAKLKEQGIIMTTAEIELWVQQFNDGKRDSFSVEKSIADANKLIKSTSSYCGDGICQNKAPGNDLGMIEDFYSCSQDCPGFNVDSTIFYCFDNDSKTPCIWEDVKAQYLGLFMGIIIALLSFTTVQEPKDKKQVTLFRYSINRFKGKNKLTNYRKS